MAQRSLMQSAQAQQPTGPSYTPKDPRQFVPPAQKDAVDRVFAAGVKLMFSPQMAQQRQQAISNTTIPVPKRLSDNVLGLMLTLDKMSKGGIPVQALFPAAVMLLNEAANILVHAGQAVSQDDYNSALQILYVQIGKKLGGSNDQLMQGAQSALQKSQSGQSPQDMAANTGAPVSPGSPMPPGGNVATPPGAMPPGGAPPAAQNPGVAPPLTPMNPSQPIVTPMPAPMPQP